MANDGIYIEVSQRRHETRARVMERLSGSMSAVLMIIAAIVALIVTNVGFHDPIHHFLMTEVGITVGTTFVGLTIEQIVNDLLMAFFFLLVGCELKYEVTVGALAKPKQAILPMVAALGGVCGPALIYMFMNMGGEGADGWAIPTATDIAFALAVMSLFGSRIPVGVKVFFSTLAIADDLVAIIVIALFYSTDISVAWLGLAALTVGGLFLLNRFRVNKLTPYMLLGAVLWLCFFNAGIHATLAGVVLAFTLPVKSNVNLKGFGAWVSGKASELGENYDSERLVLGQHEVTKVAREVEDIAHDVTPPLQRLEHSITFPVNYIVLPIFAFVNAQVYIAGADMGAILTSPETLGVLCGLVLGKPVGILITTYACVKLFKFSLPQNATWGHMLGIGMLAGIGFTMAILVSGLAFADEALVMNAKVGILLGTLIAAVAGMVYLYVYLNVSEKRARLRDEGVEESAEGGASV